MAHFMSIQVTKVDNYDKKMNNNNIYWLISIKSVINTKQTQI